MADVVFNRSHDVMQFLSWYCANTAPNLSLVISEIYDVLQRISEYSEYFESFQLNIQLEKSYSTFDMFTLAVYSILPLKSNCMLCNCMQFYRNMFLQ